jgi:hypothetical protein
MAKNKLAPNQVAKWKSTLAIIKEAEANRREMASEDPIPFDTSHVFQLYATFCGDIERTAAACNLQPIDVLRMANEDDWHIKLESIIKLKKSGKPGDVERAISRAMNFVQAHRMRLFLDRIVSRLSNMCEEELLKYMMTTTTKTNKDGVVTETTALNTRPFADLTASLEKVHHMLYMALGDTTGERDKRRALDTEAEASHSDIHAAIAEAMAKVGSQSSIAKSLSDAQLAVAQEAVAKGVSEGFLAPDGLPLNTLPKAPPTPPETPK